MRIIAHRRNTAAELLATPVTYGVEVDIRTAGSRLILHHDPFVHGEAFIDWLDHYRHGTLILNVKEEGLEGHLLPLLSDRGIADFFFLDQSIPFLVKTASQGESRCAARVSEYEPIDTALALSGKVQWVWVDCFTRFPLTTADAARLRAAGFKLCVVSPELHGRTDAAEVVALRALIAERHIAPDAVCTKTPDRWLA